MLSNGRFYKKANLEHRWIEAYRRGRNKNRNKIYKNRNKEIPRGLSMARYRGPKDTLKEKRKKEEETKSQTQRYLSISSKPKNKEKKKHS